MIRPFKKSILANDIEAVSACGFLLKSVHVQTEYICMLAVEHNGIALQWVHNQTPDICLAAVKQDLAALQYIHDENMYNYVMQVLKLS